jgi:DNA gyrase subunit B
MTSNYTADGIQVLKGLEAVRKRPAMYIGGTGVNGLHHLVYEVVDNSIDEALAGFCDHVQVFISPENVVTVVDNGRGIPVDLHPEQKRPALEVVMTMLHAGGKFDKKSYKVSGGLHGVGVSVVNALSEWLTVEVRRDGAIWKQRYERGVPRGDVQRIGDSTEQGTTVTFVPDKEIFETTEFSFDTLSQRLRELAFLNNGVRIDIEDQRGKGRRHEFRYEGGIKEFVKHLNGNKVAMHPEPIYVQAEREGVQCEIAMQYNDSYVENIFAFANNINTTEGGTHLVGFKAALTRVVNNYAQKNNLLKNEKMQITGEDVREGLAAVISVKLAEPQFEGQTKTKLGNSEVKGLVESIVSSGLGEFPRAESADRPPRHRQDAGGGALARSGPQGARADAPQVGARLDVAARQARRLPEPRSGRVRTVPSRGRLRRRLRENGPRPRFPGHPAAQGQDPERREGAARQDAVERGNSQHHHGARHRHRGRRVRCRQAALRAHHHPERCRRRWRPHPHPDPHLLLPAHEGAHRAGASLHRPAAALQPQEGLGSALRV